MVVLIENYSPGGVLTVSVPRRARLCSHYGRLMYRSTNARSAVAIATTAAHAPF